MNHSFRDFDAIRRALQQHGGLLTVQMGDLRDAAGAGRLGVHVRENIADELERRDILHQPEALPKNQFDSVRLYMKDTAIAKTIDAVRAVGDGRADEILRTMAAAEPPRVSYASPVMQETASGPIGDLIRSLDRAEARRRDFVGLKWFKNVALPSDNYDWSATEAACDAAIREAIKRGIVLTGKAPNPVKPQFPVTSIRLNRDLPEVRAALSTESRKRLEPIAIRGPALSSTVLDERR